MAYQVTTTIQTLWRIKSPLQYRHYGVSNNHYNTDIMTYQITTTIQTLWRIKSPLQYRHYGVSSHQIAADVIHDTNQTIVHTFIYEILYVLSTDHVFATVGSRQWWAPLGLTHGRFCRILAPEMFTVRWQRLTEDEISSKLLSTLFFQGPCLTIRLTITGPYCISWLILQTIHLPLKR